MGLEGTSKALEERTSSPIAVAVEDESQLVPGTIVQVLTPMPVDPSLCFCSHLSFSSDLAPVRGISEGKHDSALGELIPVLCVCCMPSLARGGFLVFCILSKLIFAVF